MNRELREKLNDLKYEKVCMIREMHIKTIPIYHFLSIRLQTSQC